MDNKDNLSQDPRLTELLRKKDLDTDLGVAPTTVSDWIRDFAAYIPIVKRGRVRYYKKQALDVLKYVKELRENDYDKLQISELLADKGFTLDADTLEDNAIRAKELNQDRDGYMVTMQAVGKLTEELDKALTRIGELEQHYTEQNHNLDGQARKLTEQDRKLEEQARINSELQNKLDEVTRELGDASEENAKHRRYISERLDKKDSEYEELKRKASEEARETTAKARKEIASAINDYSEQQRKKGFLGRLFSK